MTVRVLASSVMSGRHMWLFCGVAVQQDDGFALACDKIVQPDAVDLGEAAFDRTRLAPMAVSFRPF